MYLAETILQVLDVDLFPGKQSIVQSFLVRLGVPSQPRNHKGQQPVYLQPLCTHITILLLTFIILVKKFHETSNILL